jgi:hypothetical protein
MAFDLSQYETVDTRIHEWYQKYPNARIETELVAHSETQFIFKAAVYREANDEKPAATGYAEERVGSNPVSKNFACEAGETSSIGRALANAGISAKGKRPSREEMEKVERLNVSEPISRHVGGMPLSNAITEKQAGYVKTICEEAFVNTGWRENPDAWKHVTEWLGNPRTINNAMDLSKSEASKIINDKRSSTGVTNLEKFLQAKQPADRDPWETPTD